MDWSQMSVSRDRILSDSGTIGSYTQSSQSTPDIDPYDYSTTKTFNKSRSYRRVFDVVTDQWRKRVNSGEILMNDLLDVRYEASQVPTIWQCDGRRVPSYYNTIVFGDFGDVGSNLAPLPVPSTFGDAIALISTDTDSLRSEAITTAYARVDVSELEMLASLGEMPETVEWFRDVLKRLISITADLKKRQYISALNRLKLSRRKGSSLKNLKKLGLGGEDAWMEWRYAIRPLIFEVKSYLEALDSKVEKASRKTARYRNYDTSSSSTIVSTNNVTAVYRVDVTREVRTERYIRSGVLYSLDPELTGWWTHLGLDAPVSALWAVTSLSFVYDWFFNIGQWIASWEPRLGLTPLANWVCETRTINVKGIHGVVPIPWTGYVILNRAPQQIGEYSCMVQVKARWANPERQILPTFRYRGLKTAQVADLVVIGRKLASQLFH